MRLASSPRVPWSRECVPAISATGSAPCACGHELRLAARHLAEECDQILGSRGSLCGETSPHNRTFPRPAARRAIAALPSHRPFRSRRSPLASRSTPPFLFATACSGSDRRVTRSSNLEDAHTAARAPSPIEEHPPAPPESITQPASSVRRDEPSRVAINAATFLFATGACSGSHRGVISFSISRTLTLRREHLDRSRSFRRPRRSRSPSSHRQRDA